MLRVISTDHKELVRQAIVIAEELSGEIAYLNIYNEGNVVRITTHRHGKLYVSPGMVSTTPLVELTGGSEEIYPCTEGNCHFGCGCKCGVDHGFVDNPYYESDKLHNGCKEDVSE